MGAEFETLPRPVSIAGVCSDSAGLAVSASSVVSSVSDVVSLSLSVITSLTDDSVASFWFELMAKKIPVPIPSKTTPIMMALITLCDLMIPKNLFIASIISKFVSVVKVTMLGGGCRIIQPRHLGADFDYSTTEINTGIKWHNGKYIYKRTFNGSVTTSLNTRWTNTHEIPNLDKIINADGNIVGADGFVTFLGSTRFSGNGAINGYFFALQPLTSGIWLAYFDAVGAVTNTPYSVTAYYTKN